MKEIPLTQGKVALVDDEDYPSIMGHKWYASNNRFTYYAVTNVPGVTRRQYTLRMHRLILNPPKGKEIDHINGNGLDNRRENLRIVTRRQNTQNRHESKSSKYVGVCSNKRGKKWTADVGIGSYRAHIKVFDNEERAALAYRNTVNLVFTGCITAEMIMWVEA